MSKGFASNYRIVLLAGVLALSFGGVAARLVQLHALPGDARLRMVDEVRRDITTLEARRGDILDARNAKLATNKPVVRVWVDPSFARPGDESKWTYLANLLGRPYAEVAEIMERRLRKDSAGRTVKNQWEKLAEDVEEQVFEQIMELNIRGVGGDRTYRRFYPRNELAAHLIGYVNKEDQPATGIEAYQDLVLRGYDGWRETERDGRRREAAQFRTREVAPSDGYTVALSIDAAVQSMVERELAAIVERYRPAGATIIVSDARTGFLLALGNTPTFNLNEYNLAADRSLASLKNIAITDQLEPGSTFKIVAAAAALEQGLVTPQTRFNTTLRHLKYRGVEGKIMDDTHPAPSLTLAEVMAQSSNNGAAQLGALIGDQRMFDYARAFGFGERSGFPFGGEISGVLNPVRKWTAADMTRIPAGYSIAATPLQIHYGMGVIASGGLLLHPQLIREIRDPAGELVQRFDSVTKRRVVSERTAATMAQLLMGVAQPGGTAAVAAIDGYQVAGKTGTAQKIINGRYSDKDHIATFTGFFPATDPRLVITVLVDDANVPGGATAYGSTVAAPSFKRLAQQLITHLDIKRPGSVPPALARFGGGP